MLAISGTGRVLTKGTPLRNFSIIWHVKPVIPQAIKNSRMGFYLVLSPCTALLHSL